MKAVVLAAGYGTRLKPLTDRLPKPLMPVLGRPLLWHIITKLTESKVAQIGVNTHHNAPLVELFLRRDAPAGAGITVSSEKVILGVAGGIGGFRDFLKDEDFFIVHNGDVLSSLPLQELISGYAREMPLGALVLHDHPDYNNVSIDADGTIIDVRDTLQPRGVFRKLAYSGVALFRRDFLDFIPEGYADLIPLLVDIIAAGRHCLRAVVVEACAWRDIGTIASYHKAHAEILLDKKRLIDETLIPRGSVFCSEDARIADDAALEGFVSAGKHCRVAEGCRLKNCIIWDNAVISRNTAIQDAIIGDGWIVHVPT